MTPRRRRGRKRNLPPAFWRNLFPVDLAPVSDHQQVKNALGSVEIVENPIITNSQAGASCLCRSFFEQDDPRLNAIVEKR